MAGHPAWIAPAGDGEILLWPPPLLLLADTLGNHHALQSADRVFIQNTSLAELRTAQRTDLKIANRDLVIASGHQTELYHPGVWAKDALACAIAERLGGQAWHLAVDTDQPKHLAMRWPGGQIAITDDSHLTSAAWSGLLRAPTEAHLARIEAELGGADLLSNTLMPQALAGLRDYRGNTSISLSAALVRAIDRADESLGMKRQTALLSPLLTGKPYLALVYHLLARAGQFAASHNRALAEYRQANGIRSLSRPMPDLAVAADQCEAPFWLDHLPSSPSPCTQGEGRGEGSSDLPNGERPSKGDPHPSPLPEYMERGQMRARAMVHRVDGKWALTSDSDSLLFDESLDAWQAASRLGDFLSAHHLRLTPRALTLTLFFRLLIVDQFIHGIGGARYDRVTDAVINDFFGLTPPRFCVTTATLLPPAAVGRQRVNLPLLALQGHRIKHQLLGGEKPPLIAAIAAAPRRSSQRAALFSKMHSLLAAAAPGHPLLLDWQTRFDQAKVQSSREEILFDRELFFALQTPQRLHSLLTRQRELLASEP
jgi:hypothetical protein